MKIRSHIIKTVRNEKEGWSPEEIDAWMQAKSEEIKQNSPALWKFISNSQQEMFQSICHQADSEKHDEYCPAEEAQRYLLLRLLELAEMVNAQSEVEELEKLWKVDKVKSSRKERKKSPEG